MKENKFWRMRYRHQLEYGIDLMHRFQSKKISRERYNELSKSANEVCAMIVKNIIQTL
jgi:hypothetical protein